MTNWLHKSTNFLTKGFLEPDFDPLFLSGNIIYTENGVAGGFKMMDFDGGSIQNIAPHGAVNYYYPTLSPDCTKVSWTDNSVGGIYQVFIGDITVSGGINNITQVSSETNGGLQPRPNRIHPNNDIIVWSGGNDRKIIRGYKLSTMTYNSNMGDPYGTGVFKISLAFNETGDKLYYSHGTPETWSVDRADIDLNTLALSNNTAVNGEGNVRELPNIILDRELLVAGNSFPNEDLLIYDTWDGINASNVRNFKIAVGIQTWASYNTARNWILYTSTETGNAELYRKPANSNNSIADEYRLTNTAATEFYAAWGDIPA